jgi:ABC-type enterochelin transport system substrate-binding protein
VRIGRGNPNEVFNVVDRDTGQILGTGNTGRQADAIANDIIANSDRKVVVQRAEQFDTADSFGIELTPSMAEAFKAYMAKGGYVNEEILLPYGD